MKIITYSDLHLEFGSGWTLPSDLDADLTFKDYSPLSKFLTDWKKPVLYITGNHEYYTRTPRDKEEEAFKKWLTTNCGRPIRPYEEMYRTSLRFLQEPHKIWTFGSFEDKRAVLKLAFTDRLTYVRNEGYRTPDLALPFKLLGDDFGLENKMVP